MFKALLIALTLAVLMISPALATETAIEEPTCDIEILLPWWDGAIQPSGSWCFEWWTNEEEITTIKPLATLYNNKRSYDTFFTASIYPSFITLKTGLNQQVIIPRGSTITEEDLSKD